MTQPMKRTDRPFTYADYCSWPEDERWEVIDGVAYSMAPAPARLHSQVSMELSRQLANFFQEKSCEVHHAPFDVRLALEDEPAEEVKTVVQPDIVVVCDQAKLDDKGCRGAPDLVVEILSPSSSSRDCILKRALYEKHGVREYWIVDPTNRLVTVFSLDQTGKYGPIRIFGEADTLSTTLFPGLDIDLAAVFPAQPKVVRESPAKYL